ncbi:hypothetical protein P7C71_g3769, partial [Lecanoromycetidae sp. Uapishka_2]
MGPISLPSALQNALISTLPASGYYIPNFITATEESLLLDKINTAPLPTWKQLSHRRLQAHPSVLTANNTLLDARLPTWLSNAVIPRMLSIPLYSGSPDNIFSNSPHGAPNHCLINEYLPGQGIQPHEDGGAYYPVVATVSLGSHIVLDVKPKDGISTGWRILQEPRSLLITTEDLYRETLHGISEVQIDEELNDESVVNWDLLGDAEPFAGGKAFREKRVSLTFRDVIRVKRLGKAFGGLVRK